MTPLRIGAAAALAVAVVTLACGGSSSSPDTTELCSGYENWQTSLYVLPFPVGTSYRVAQGNCSPPGDGHRGSERYGYDFQMSIGTPFSAARAGTVVHVETSHFDGQIAATGLDNYIVIRHDDGTHALYGHITHDGSSVAVNDLIIQGQPIGFSGNTGNTNNFPHLHLSVHVCDPVTGGSAGCPTKAVTFRNTDANPDGLQLNHTYTALPY